MVDVAVICGSASDGPVAEKVFATLNEHRVSYDYRVISAHRDPENLDEYRRGDAGSSSPSPDFGGPARMIASKTDRPVIGVPVSEKLLGLDALLSIVQMPKGVPVACVGVDNGENAALLAIRILKAGRALD